MAKYTKDEIKRAQEEIKALISNNKLHYTSTLYTQYISGSLDNRKTRIIVFISGNEPGETHYYNLSRLISIISNGWWGWDSRTQAIKIYDANDAIRELSRFCWGDSEGFYTNSLT